MSKISKTIGIVMIIMVFSRLMSLISNQYYVTFYGVNDNVFLDIYTYATQMPNIIFNSLGTAIATVVIPIFAGHISTGKKEGAFKFANNVICFSLLVTFFLALIGVLFSPNIVKLTDFQASEIDFAITALRIMFPIMLFYALNYVLQGILQSLGKFNMPAVVSLPGSLGIILYVFFWGDKYGIKGLLIATFIGLAMQTLILIPPIFKTEYRFKPELDWENPDIRKAAKLIPPVLLGTIAFQLNMFFNLNVGSYFPEVLTLLYTVQNLILYGVLAFIYSITSVLFPKLTMMASNNKFDEFKELLLKVLKTIVYLIIPATTIFIILGEDVIGLIYGWGKLTKENIYMAGVFMALYAIGITAIGIKEVTDRAFYAIKDTKKPAINGAIIMSVNIISTIVLLQYIGVYALPISYSLSAIVGAIVILVLLKRKIGSYGGFELLKFTLKVIFSSSIMAVSIIAINYFLMNFNIDNILIDKCVKLFVPGTIGGVIYFVATYILKISEAREFLGKFKKIIGKNS